MVNKKGAWFLTLFSIILVLSVYYITMPTELLISDNIVTSEPTIKTEESTMLVSLRVEEDEEKEKEINSLKEVISDSESSIEDKNTAFEKIKEINNTRSMEDVLEEKIKSEHNLESFIKIENEYISATIVSKEKNNEIANKIIRTIQKEYKENKKITIRFQDN